MKSSLIAPIIIGAFAIPLFIFAFSQRSSIHNESNKSESTKRPTESTKRPVRYKHVITENANSRDNFVSTSGQKSIRTTVSGLKFGGTKSNGHNHKSNGNKSNGHNHKKTHKKI